MIKQLEDTANAYLSVLAEGGLVLDKQPYRHSIPCLFNPLCYSLCYSPSTHSLVPSFSHSSILSFLLSFPPGGIQLSLQSEKGAPNDENNSDTSSCSSDKIIKSVWVRHHGEGGGEGGGFRERGLSQLSGGQWRRVSMALDFAFAEVINARGDPSTISLFNPLA